MKHTKKLYFTALAGCLLAASVPCTADNQENTSLFDAAVICPENVTASRDAVLDYSADTWTMNYHLENTGNEAAVCSLLVPVPVSLSEAQSGLYDFSFTDTDSSSLSEYIYFTPLFSTASISETEITADQLYSFREQNSSLPSDPGTLYTLRTDSVSEEDTAVLNIQAKEEENCRIYPIGCTYTAKEGSYEISAVSGYDTCYLFLTGTEETDYTADFIEGSGYEFSSEVSTLDAFMELSCRIFWNDPDTSLNDPVTQKTLLNLLASYLDNSNVTVALDLIPSLRWLVTQQLFEVYAYDVTVSPGETVTVSILRNCELPVNGVSINPVLTQNGTALAQNRLHIVFRDDYTGASLRRAKGSFDKKESAFTLKDTSNGIYQVVLNKTPVWVRAYQYIIPMCIVMAVFLLLCIPAYMSRKKASGKTGNSSQK